MVYKKKSVPVIFEPPCISTIYVPAHAQLSPRPIQVTVAYSHIFIIGFQFKAA